jgi:hypothetical protein
LCGRPSLHCREKEPALPRAPPHAATPRSDMRPTLEADGNVACAIFSHLEDPRDRIALAAVSRVFRDAEKSDASLPVALGALKRHGDRFLYSSYATAPVPQGVRSRRCCLYARDRTLLSVPDE